MVPSPEAIAWARRADAWAQQPPAAEQGAEGDQPVSRWSEVAPTGRPGLPAEGVGWRTETAEWRAAEQSARWRQTTEWRSASGTHGWRSTTEAWQTGSGAEGLLPPADPSTRQQLAISGTAWPTPQSASQAPPETPPSWQQPPSDRTPPSDSAPWQAFTETTPPWQQPADQGPARQQPADSPPAWQQFAGPPPAPWQQTAAGSVPWEQAAPSASPPWEQGSDTTQPWQQLADPASGRQQAADPDPTRRRGSSAPAAEPHQRGGPPWSGAGWSGNASSGTAWSGTAWSGTADDGRHLVREDDRAQWRGESAAGMAGVDSGPRPVGRRRAPESGRNTGGGTGWSGRSEADNWAGHTDTGSMPTFVPPPMSDAPAWSVGSDTPSRRDDSSAWSERVGTPDRLPGTDHEDWRWEATGRVRDDADRAGDETVSWQHGTPSTAGTAGRRRAGPDPDLPDWKAARSTPGAETPSRYRDRVAGPDAETASWQIEPEADSPGWRSDLNRAREIEGPSRRQGQADSDSPSGRRDEPATDWRARSGSWRAEPDSLSWGRGDEPRTDGWRQPAIEDRDRPSWRDDEPDAGSWHRASEPASDPWDQGVADTGVIPANWQQAMTDTGSWRVEPDEDGGRYGGGRRRAQDDGREEAPIDPEVWSRGSAPGRRGTNWPVDEPVDEPDADQPSGSQPAGPAGTDWRRELRAEVRRENPDDAVTEIRRRVDPAAWQEEERAEAARGSAVYRERTTGDWRRDLAGESDLAEGESRRFGTHDFVPFQPVGSAAAPAPPASAPPFNGTRAGGSRAELLVGSERPSARWQDPPDTEWPPRGAVDGYQGGTAGGSYERRSVSSLPGPSGRSTDLLEPDDDDDIEQAAGGPLAAVGYTVIWYGVPVVLFVLYMLVLSGAQRAHALSTLAGAAPQFGLSLVLSMLVAVGLRRASGSWKGASVGLAAAVMGGGLATVLTSAITGNALN